MKQKKLGDKTIEVGKNSLIYFDIVNFVEKIGNFLKVALISSRIEDLLIIKISLFLFNKSVLSYI